MKDMTWGVLGESHAIKEAGKPQDENLDAFSIVRKHLQVDEEKNIKSKSLKR